MARWFDNIDTFGIQMVHIPRYRQAKTYQVRDKTENYQAHKLEQINEVKQHPQRKLQNKCAHLVVKLKLKACLPHKNHHGTGSHSSIGHSALHHT